MYRQEQRSGGGRKRDEIERIVLGQNGNAISGQASVSNQSSEVVFDQRLFNRSQGMGSGFGDEEDYNISDKPLLQPRQAQMGQLYRKAMSNTSFTQSTTESSFVSSEDDGRGQKRARIEQEDQQ
ncbi:MAG: hypothetical protein EZS28_031602 [Streblomastix strix]|uniref:Uncharacterized protein n=1 Tax=Streblomastix strix TaxID=222440 RepID=A0A5J4URR2_9EUKA|nr:MAG: hypothetical protein EZS28_031599 [Streblomastix strix]KAA6372874.1 MAG: hypothetical protein EZS28_031602 [Streblomastix strix]